MKFQGNAPRKIKISRILAAFAGVFILLLGLIWWIGTLGQNRLREISIRADENTRAYTDRLKLAIDIREATNGVITEARLYRNTSHLRPRGPVYRIDLNQAKYRLDKLLAHGEQLWSGANQQNLPQGEVAAWRKVQKAIPDFWRTIEAEEQSHPDQTGEEGSSQSSKPASSVGALPAPVPTATPWPALQNTNTLEEFYQIRTGLYDAARELSEVIVQGQTQAVKDLGALQANSASDVGNISWVTLIVGAIIGGITYMTIRGQLNQIARTERQKQEAEGRKLAVFDSQSNDIMVLNEQGVVLEVNRAFLDHFHVGIAALAVQDYRAALSTVPEIAGFVGQTLEVANTKKVLRDRIEVKAHNGAPGARLFDVKVSPLKVEDEIHGRVVTLDDVTEEESVREELRRSRTLSAVGQITAQVAHEIYNPLGAVKLNLELLEMQIGEDADVKHTIARLKRGVEHLSTIVMDLRYLTRPREPERKPTDLNKLLDEVVELASDRLERSRICITRDYSPEIPAGELDPQQLRKVFLNLLINAVEASPHNGEVALSTRYLNEEEARSFIDLNGSNGAIVISVVDHGIGMSSETRKHLFEAFYTTKRNGTGLGMMITQEIVKKHGGKILVESEEGKGTQIDVYLPID